MSRADYITERFITIFICVFFIISLVINNYTKIHSFLFRIAYKIVIII